MAIILFEDNAHQTLLPLTFTRPVADLRIGILTIAEKWGRHFNTEFSFHTRDYLQGKFPINITADNLFINGAVCPDNELVEAIDKLRVGDALKYRDTLVAVRLNAADAKHFRSNTMYGQAINYRAYYSNPTLSGGYFPQE